MSNFNLLNYLLHKKNILELGSDLLVLKIKFEVMIKKYFTLLLLVLNFVFAVGQNEKMIDSLTKVIQIQGNDVSKLKNLTNLGSFYVNIDASKTIEYGKQTLVIAQELKDEKYIFRAYATIGKGYFVTNEYDKALENLNKGLSMTSKNVDDLDKALALGNVANCYFGKGDFAKAIDAGFESIKLKDKILFSETDASKIKRIKISIATSYGNIGTNYERADDSENAIKYLNKSIKISRENGDNEVTSFLLSIGNIYKNKKDHKKALKYYEETYKLSKKIQNKYDQCISAINLSEELAEIKKTDLAIHYAKKGLDLSTVLKSDYHKSLAYLNFASIYENDKKYELAKEYYEKGLALAKKSENIDLEKDAYNALSNFYANTNDFKLSNETLKKYTFLKDSLGSSGITKKIINSKLKYEYDKKKLGDSIKMANEKIITKAKLSSEKNQKLAFGSFALLALAGVGFNYFLYRQKRKTNYQLTEINDKINRQNNILKTLNTELIVSEENLQKSNNSKEQLISMMSHDLLNPITAITNYNQQIISRKNNSDELLQAFKTVDAAIQPMHGLLDNMLHWTAIQKDGISSKLKNQDINDIIKEIIGIYRPQAHLKFIKLLDNLDKDFIQETDKSILSLILRNLLNNAIKYSGNETEIEISSISKTKTIIIKDQGFGMTDEMIAYLNNKQLDKIESRGTGLGLKLCFEFAEAIGAKIVFERNEVNGTLVKLNL